MQKHEGYPSGSMVDFACVADGSPILAVSSLAAHSKVCPVPSSNTYFFLVYIRLENHTVDDIPGYNLHVQLWNISLLRNWETWYIIYRVKELDCLSWLIIDSEGIFWMLPVKINALVVWIDWPANICFHKYLQLSSVQNRILPMHVIYAGLG